MFVTLIKKTSNFLEFLPAATKLGQGNIFTPVCDSVNGEGVVWSRGVSNFLGGWGSPIFRGGGGWWVLQF